MTTMKDIRRSMEDLQLIELLKALRLSDSASEDSIADALTDSLRLHNDHYQDGVDSSKRGLAIKVLAGPADMWQTDRLVKLAIATIAARKGGQPS